METSLISSSVSPVVYRRFSLALSLVALMKVPLLVMNFQKKEHFSCKSPRLGAQIFSLGLSLVALILFVFLMKVPILVMYLSKKSTFPKKALATVLE